MVEECQTVESDRRIIRIKVVMLDIGKKRDSHDVTTTEFFCRDSSLSSA